MEVRIDGNAVSNEQDIHRQLAAQLELGDGYGYNMAALRDRLLTDVPRPVHIVWTDHAVARNRIGVAAFTAFERVLAEAEQQDADVGWDEWLTYRLA